MRKDCRERQYNFKDDSGKFLRYYRDDSGRFLTLEACYFHNMTTRANNPNYKLKYKTYEDVYASEEFKDFQYFAAWCNEQIGFGTKGWVLDKDILFKDNKVYSETTCVFVPPIINSFFLQRSRIREYPTGVTWCPSENCFKAYCANLEGKNKTLGRFQNPEEASEAYILYKSRLGKELSEKFKGIVDERVVDVLNKTYDRGK